MGKKRSSNLSLPSPQNDSQKRYLNSLLNLPMTISLGPAGTGKSYIAASVAAHLYKEKKIQKIIITRPTIPTGKSIGFFPGTLEEKMNPWCQPILTTLTEALSKGAIETGFKNGNLEIVPFETIRGRSFDDSFVILDEAQNTTEEEMKAFLTRIGENSIAAINGDISQSDLKTSHNGLSEAVKKVQGSPELSRWVSLVEFSSEDIVRSGLCRLWVEAFDN